MHPDSLNSFRPGLDEALHLEKLFWPSIDFRCRRRKLLLRHFTRNFWLSGGLDDRELPHVSLGSSCTSGDRTQVIAQSPSSCPMFKP